MNNLISNGIQNITDVSVNCNGEISHDKTNHFEYVKNDSKKSHVEKSIERLYGPGALGIGFQSRRSLIEQQRHPVQDDSKIVESPKSLPRVFKHLRPEFRSQLCGSTSSSSCNGKSDSQTSSKENKLLQSVKCKAVHGPVVHHIPIELEENRPSIKKSENIGIDKSINISLQKLQVNQKTAKMIQKLDKSIPVVINNLGHNYNLRSRSMTPKNVNVIASTNVTSKMVNYAQIGKENVATPNKNSLEITVKAEESDVGGRYFLNLAEVEVDYLNTSANLIEKDINDFFKLMDEELKGKLLATVGKIRLLVSQKIKQFKGLCHKNIKCSPDDEFPTTDDDLAGFWDMVFLQIISVKQLISEWAATKQNGWKEIVPECKEDKPRRPMYKINKVTMTAEQKAQMESRKKAQEERRKAMKEAIMMKRKQARDNVNLEISDRKMIT